jgi:hypothetical protein
VCKGKINFEKGKLNFKGFKGFWADLGDLPTVTSNCRSFNEGSSEGAAWPSEAQGHRAFATRHPPRFPFRAQTGRSIPGRCQQVVL